MSSASSIDSTAALEDLVRSLQSMRKDVLCAIDTEADSLHRFRESLCLIQFAVPETCLLIDPLAVENLDPLANFLDDATVWMHGADYDMTMLKREFGRLPARVYDTQIGARLLGARHFGLADLVMQYFDVALSKSSQKADWGKRPLTEKMTEYALNDVRYLLPMSDMIVDRLKDLDRYEWFEESCSVARQKVLERDDSREDAWRINGSGKLEPRELAALRALWHWRNQEAEQWDKPTFMVVTNKTLLEWAPLLATGRKIALPKHYRSERLKRFSEMLEKLREEPESEWPGRIRVLRRKRDPHFDAKLENLLRRRDRAAKEANIDGSLIASRSVLESIAGGQATIPESLMSWQIQLLGEDF